MSFIIQPNLPKNAVKTAIIGKTDDKLTAFIQSFGIGIITADQNPLVDPAIANHADINVFHYGNGCFLLDISQRKLYNTLVEYGVEASFVEVPVCGKYPGDCKLNFVQFPDKLIGRIDIADERIKALQLKKISVNQGYSKCSTCVINENAVITDDSTIEKACIKNGIDVLLIDKGDIILKGHEYGFIGGASALVNRNHIIFFGDIKTHRNFSEIESFLSQNGCKFSYLKDYPLTDIGGMIAFDEVE